MMVENTGKKLIRASLWVVTGKMLARVLDLITLLVLASLLTPEDFGLVALAMTFILIFETISDLPVGQVILRAKEPNSALYDTAFTISIIRSICVGVIILLLAFPIAYFFDESRLSPLISALALAAVLRGCNSPKLMDSIRNYDMRPEFIMTFTSKLASLIAVIIIFVLTKSYWAIAIATITSPVVSVLLSYVLRPYRPRFCLSEWREFTEIFGWYTLSQWILALNIHSDRLILGRFLPISIFGRYTMSSDLVNIPFQGILNPITGPLISAYSRNNTTESLQNAWIKSLSSALFFMAPTLLGIAILSDIIILSVLGNDWGDAAPYLTYISIGTLPSILSQLFLPLASAHHRIRLITQRYAIELAVKLPMTCLGIYIAGVWGAIAARLISNTVSALYSLSAAGLITQQSIWSQLKSLKNVFIGIIVFSIIAYIICPSDSGDVEGAISRLVLFFQATVICGVAFCAQCITVFFLWHFQGRPNTFERVIFSRLAPYIPYHRHQKSSF